LAASRSAIVRNAPDNLISDNVPNQKSRLSFGQSVPNWQIAHSGRLQTVKIRLVIAYPEFLALFTGEVPATRRVLPLKYQSLQKPWVACLQLTYLN
jgi:hypothetical protein